MESSSHMHKMLGWSRLTKHKNRWVTKSDNHGALGELLSGARGTQPSGTPWLGRRLDHHLQIQHTNTHHGCHRLHQCWSAQLEEWPHKHPKLTAVTTPTTPLGTMKPQRFLLSPFPPFLPPRKGTPPSSGCCERSLTNTNQDNAPTHTFANQQLLNACTDPTHSHINNPCSNKVPATHSPWHWPRRKGCAIWSLNFNESLRKRIQQSSA